MRVWEGAYERVHNCEGMGIYMSGRRVRGGHQSFSHSSASQGQFLAVLIDAVADAQGKV